jgi:hypothetical protein
MADAAKRNGNGGPVGPDLETLPIGEVLSSLKTNPDKGLSDDEARGRLAAYGPNALPEKHESFARKVLNYFIGPIAFMIEAAALVSAFLGRWDDFAVIFGLLIFNAALELWQDRKASSALAALKTAWRPRRRCSCGSMADRDASDWCPAIWCRYVSGDRPGRPRLIGGDHRLHRPGRADRRITAGHKKPGDEAYSGSVVKQGEMRGRHRHRLQHLLRPHRQAGGRRRFGQPCPARHVPDRQLPDRRRGGAGADHGRVRCLARHRDTRRLEMGRRAQHPAVRVDSAGGVDPGRDAGGVFDHHGAWGRWPCPRKRRSSPSSRRSRKWRASTSSARTRRAR